MTMVRTADGWVQTLQNDRPVSIPLMAIPRNEGVPRDVTIRLPLPGTHGVVVVWAITVLNESLHELRSFSGRFLVRQPERALRVLGVFIGHDSSLATAVGGELLMVFELERWTRIRQYQFKMSQFEIQHVIIPVVRFMTGMRHPSFDVLAAGKTMASHLGTTDGSLNKNVISSSFVLALQGLFNAGRVEWVDHHWAHATLAMYEVSAASVNRMLIFSYDGNGNDGTFNVYEAQPNAYKLRLLKKEPICLGPYADSAPSLGLCRQADVCPTDPAGTFMAYSAMGQANLSWVPAIQAAFSHSAVHDMLVVMRRFFEAHGVQSTALYETVGKNFAATVQRSFELLVLETVQRHFRDWSATLPPSIAIGNGDVAVALTGGSALNIITNHLVREALNPVPVYVPAAPGDAGQVVGIVWAVAPPPFLSRSGEAELTALVGPAVFDGDSLPTYVKARNGSLVHVRFVAEQLADGAIVGVVRGRMEWGPRALGHRYE
jgi:carbamoyltransferase